MLAREWICSTFAAAKFKTYNSKLITQKMDLPQDPMMLFSVVNMKLRDFYPSLDALCEDLNVDKEELIAKLAAFGFEYSEEHNKFW